MKAAGDPIDKSYDPDSSLRFSAPVISAHTSLGGIAEGQRLDVYTTSLDARDRIFPWEAAERAARKAEG